MFNYIASIKSLFHMGTRIGRRQDFAIIDTGGLNYIACLERSGKQVKILVLRASAKAWYVLDAEKCRDSEYANRFANSCRVAEKTHKM